ncbi:MAG: metallophosphoesterase [Myxococcales bacterium]|nr:MAG: metallophosphoesterase [Myxococcales bacterium]
MSKILHLSDVHVHAPLRLLEHHDFASKRLAGAVNLALRRSKLFTQIPAQLAALAKLAKAQQVDAVLCTGDYTSLGSSEEMSEARELMQVLIEASPRFITMPGNHDVYTFRAIKERRFEQAFGEFLVSDTAPGAGRQSYPLLRHLDPNCSVVVLNSAIAHRAFWRSDGFISEDQLKALDTLLDQPEMQKRFIVVATHYAPYKKNGKLDTPRHGLGNADALMAILKAKLIQGMLVHGHIHHRYFLPREQVGIPIFCCGSSTHQGREGIWLYDIKDQQCQAYGGHWNGEDYILESNAHIAS